MINCPLYNIPVVRTGPTFDSTNKPSNIRLSENGYHAKHTGGAGWNTVRVNSPQSTGIHTFHVLVTKFDGLIIGFVNDTDDLTPSSGNYPGISTGISANGWGIGSQTAINTTRHHNGAITSNFCPYFRTGSILTFTIDFDKRYFTLAIDGAYITTYDYGLVFGNVHGSLCPAVGMYNNSEVTIDTSVWETSTSSSPNSYSQAVAGTAIVGQAEITNAYDLTVKIKAGGITAASASVWFDAFPKNEGLLLQFSWDGHIYHFPSVPVPKVIIRTPGATRDATWDSPTDHGLALSMGTNSDTSSRTQFSFGRLNGTLTPTINKTVANTFGNSIGGLQLIIWPDGYFSFYIFNPSETELFSGKISDTDWSTDLDSATLHLEFTALDYTSSVNVKKETFSISYLSGVMDTISAPVAYISPGIS